MDDFSDVPTESDSHTMSAVATGGELFEAATGGTVEPVAGYLPGNGRRPANGRVHLTSRDEWRDIPLPAMAAAWGEAYREVTDGAGLLRDARVLIVGDCTLYRDYLAAVLASHGAIAPGVAWDLPSLVASYETTVPRVILLDMSTRNSAMLLRQALKLSPHVRVVVLGVSEDDESEIVACAEAGVAGYHLRSESLKDLLVLIHKVAAGESLCSPRVSAILLRRLSTLASQRQPAAKELVLTSREIQILRLLEMGLSNRDIAEQLCIAVHTVKNHVHSLLAKLGVSTRAQAAALARATAFTDAALEN
jgi:DNA-binding NarL/FixJ family response regulator